MKFLSRALNDKVDAFLLICSYFSLVFMAFTVGEEVKPSYLRLIITILKMIHMRSSV